MLTEDEIKERLPERFRTGFFMPTISDNVDDMQIMSAYYFCCFQEMQGALIQNMRQMVGMDPIYKVVAPAESEQ